MGRPLSADDVAWDVADRLRKSREAAGLEQVELAERIEVSRQTVGNYENRRVQPQKTTIMLWALVTGVPVQWLRTGVWPEDSRGDTGRVRGTSARSSTDRASDYGSLVRQIRPGRHADPRGTNMRNPA